MANLHAVSRELDPSEPQRLARSAHAQRVGSWTTEGLTYLEGRDIWLLPMEGEEAGEAYVVVASPFNEQHPAVSPNGNWLAYSSNENDRREVFVRPYPGGGPATLISTGEAYAPAWSRSGHELFYRDSLRRMMVVDVSAGPNGELVAARPRLLFEQPYAQTDPIRSYDVARDGRFVMNSEDRFTPRPVTRISFVHNWFEEFQRIR